MRSSCVAIVFASLTGLLSACHNSTSGDIPDGSPNGSVPRDLAIPGADGSGPGADLATNPTGPTKTVFIILMENHNWSSFKGSASATYINGTLLPKTAHAEMYFNPAGIHPSEPNYLWLEAGDNFGVTNDNPPAMNHQTTTDHLVSQLDKAGISWMSYQEDVPTGCPLTDSGLYAAKHNPMVFFDDVTENMSPTSNKCASHMRSLQQFFDDLQGKNGQTVARYNFITPNLCNDGHGETLGTNCPSLLTDLVKKSDDFLGMAVPQIENAAAFKDAGVLFITWDEGEGLVPSDGPIGMIVDSPKAKAGYANTILYDHSSTLKTIETIFGVPLLRGAMAATNLSDLFMTFP
jgi:hypothetical protein